nr:uncharacterized protein LOC109165199 isoform X2 [Ipomoea batatas]
MKSRSNGLPMPNPQDDWGDGSWTVDCVCGVNFDDGEEMVNCDDCGVWVHTRCVRYVKSEKLFACDKCKNKNSRNDSEETEVAQLLVELPTKTLNMENPFNPSFPSQRPFRLWTELPMEERVHVQGVPGGDPALFAGISSIFSPQLWKCTGYVPKKFNFQYREFPCWDTENSVGDDKQRGGNNETTTDNGAGVLLSLSKESNLLAPVSNSVAVKSDAKCDVSSSKQTKRLDGSDSDGIKLHTNVKKDASSVHRITIHSGKRKKEEFGISKDHRGKMRKKAQIVEKEGDFKKKDPHIRTACKILNGEKEMQLEGALPNDRLAEGPQRLDTDCGYYKGTSNSRDQHSKMSSFDASKQNSSSETLLQEQNLNQAASKVQNLQSEKDGMAASILEHSQSANLPIKEEDGAGGREALTISAKIELQKSESGTTATVSDDLEVKSLQNCRDLTGDNVTCSSVPETEAKADDVHGDFDIQSSSPCDAMLERTRSLPHHADTSNILVYESVKVNDAPVVNTEGRDHKSQDVDSSNTILGNNKMKNADGLSRDLFQSNQESTISEDTERAKNSSSGLKHGTKPAEDVAKPSSTTISTATAPSQRKVIVTMGKSSSTSSTSLVPKPSASESCVSSNAHNHDINSMQRGKSDNNLSSKMEATSFNVARDEEGHENPKKVVKELPKSSVGSASKAQVTKITYASSSKRTLSDSKDSIPHSSHRTISVRNVSANSGSGESSSSLQSEGASSVQNKPSGTILHQKGDKVNQSGSQPSVKVSATLMHPPTLSSSPAALSDEELALLLHQQLNSSPRVPRVPRMRHAGSLPTLTSPAATSTLMKRTSSGGVKDHGLTSRRRKDSGKDGSISSREGVDEAKKREGLTSPDYRREDTHAKREAEIGSSKSVLSLKKTSPSSTAAGSNGCPSSHEAKEQKLSSRNSQRSTVGDDARVTGRPSHRTLPALIAEIMSKGERMTYEELCNAVLPHWPHLRKHNGERYAYSSHSQAVLDCLRNRSEWACLVDRGPKTSTSRKRRKLDNDSHSNELEDNEDGSGRDRSGKDVSSSKSLESPQEEYPKRKRNIRKRRRLALRGRGIKDVRRRHRAGVVSDDEDDETASLSNSSDDSMFSEDDMEGATSPATKEASGSSDDRTMS